MNWAIVIQGVLTVIGGLVGAGFTYMGTRSQNKSQNESVYAGSVKEMVEQVQKLLDELESKNGKIAELSAQVAIQSKTIQTLTKQIGELKEQINTINKRSF